MTGTSHSQGHTAREDHDPSIHPRDVRPGMVVWNPYGGARGRAVVASEPRERPDGAVEFDTEDGRTGIFRPRFRLSLDRAATERLARQRQEASNEVPKAAGPGRTADPEIPVTAGSDGNHPQAGTTSSLATSPRGPRTGTARPWTTQAIADAIHHNPLRDGQPESRPAEGYEPEREA